nr:type IV secretory pathway TraG/TraD family ATPase VirD4 [Mucilaginibacter sp. X4EP1]
MKETAIKAAQFTFGLASDFFTALLDAFSKPQAFNAEFGSERLIANRLNKGFVVSSNRKITRNMSYRNLMISSVTGGGKTTKLLVPSLLSLRNCSMIVNDNSKELYNLTSGYKSSHMVVKTLNLSDSTVSSGFNILANAKSLHDISRIAHIIVLTTLDKGNSDQFWSLSVKTLLQIFIQLTLLQEEEFRHMANVLHLLKLFSAKPEKVDALVAKTHDEKLVLDYSSFLAIPERTRDNIVASAKAALQIFESPEVAKVTSFNSIDFSEFRKTPTLLYLHVSVNDAKFLSCLLSIFFEQFYSAMLEHLPAKTDLDCFCLIDEASSLYIPLLPSACANGRKFRCGSIVVVQSKGQLKTFYKDESGNLCANCVTHIHLAGQTALEELREIEALSGKCIYKDKDGKERTKSLVTVDEIRQLPDNRSLILCANNPIILGRVTPYWRNFSYRSYTKIPPVPLRGDIPDGPIPLIKL